MSKLKINLATDALGAQRAEGWKVNACLPWQSALENMLEICVFEQACIFLEHITLTCFIC